MASPIPVLTRAKLIYSCPDRAHCSRDDQRQDRPGNGGATSGGQAFSGSGSDQSRECLFAEDRVVEASGWQQHVAAVAFLPSLSTHRLWSRFFGQLVQAKTCCITTDCRCDDVVGGQLRASISAHVVLAAVNIAPLFYVLCAFTSYCTSLVGGPVHAGV